MIRRNTGRFAKSFLGPKEIPGVLRGSRGSQRLEGVSKSSGRPSGVLVVIGDPKDLGSPRGLKSPKGPGGPRGLRGPGGLKGPRGPRDPWVQGLGPTFPPCPTNNVQITYSEQIYNFF